MAQEIRGEFGEDYILPEGDVDLSELIKDKPVVHMDSVALFSASQRANGYRKRFKHKGQTASIYLSDTVAEEKGKYQIGTLVHTIGVKGGSFILDSIPDQKQSTVQPLLNYLPYNTPIFTDQGYPYLKRYNRNHRAVNHSLRAKREDRNTWGRDRWCKDGVNNQVAEGFQRTVKYAFLSGYSYVSPKYSQLYLNEYAGIKALRVHGLNRILGEGCVECGEYMPSDTGMKAGLLIWRSCLSHNKSQKSKTFNF